MYVTAESLEKDFRRWRAVVPGEVLAQFVVDTLGRPEPASLCLLFKDVGPALAGQVVAILPRLRFRPAERPKGRRVRQVVQTPFRFYWLLSNVALQLTADFMELRLLAALAGAHYYGSAAAELRR